MFFNFPTLGLSDSRVGEVTLSHCEPQCYLTNDKYRLNSSDAVVVHMYGLDVEKLPHKTSHQKWIFWLMEPPHYGNFRDYDRIAGYFNWTMTYRSDSDVPTPYGETVRKTDAPPEKDLQSLWISKSKMAVWMVSNCKSQSRRELFVADLRGYIDVDVIGHCGNNSCPKDKGSACYEEHERKYFFILAFENSICKDYVTEKLFWALQYALVPVVFGGANYRKMAPERSYIDATSFETPRALAEYLKAVASNFSVYASYLDWKARYKVNRLYANQFCPLCAKLHSAGSKKTSVYWDMRKWYEEQANCRSWRR
ncbi:unnamed protein product [Ixodes hexagonus]